MVIYFFSKCVLQHFLNSLSTYMYVCIYIYIYSLQKKSKLETDNSVSNPSGNGIPDGLETEFSVFKTLVSNCVRLNSVSN